jgi:hypothetical protein
MGADRRPLELELPGEWTADELHAIADALYPPGDERLDPRAWTWTVCSQVGRLRSRLRGLADELEEDDR